MKKGLVNKKETFTDADIRANRKFPTWATILLVIIVVVQLGLIALGIWYQPKPQDLIHQYYVTVQPLDDGSLDIEYRFVWEALDKTEELTWVEIGMANEYFTVYPDSVTSNIASYSKYTDGDYVSLQLDFDRPYKGGEIVEFSFKVNQRDMLCKNEAGYFYEFVPCWFNAIQVQRYEFRWMGKNDTIWRGSLDYGEFVKMTAQYGMDDFAGCQTVKYWPFYEDDACNELRDLKILTVVMCSLFAALLIIAEVYLIDSYVSYHRGRGFLSGHGYYVHTYGRSNPHYIRARNKYNATHSGGRRGSGGGCACACACACAGGGRAGCSQKDTYSISKRSSQQNQ